MNFAADLHLHTRWSRACSPEAGLEGFHAWARLKGIALVGTGDFTHPRHLADIGAKLVERDGLLALRDPPRDAPLEGARPADLPVRFVPTAEISSIYKKGGATRKVHSLVLVPTVDDARRLAARLATLGNIASDGRPILGLDPKDLLAMLLEISPGAFLVPAHVWTPWFSLFGSRSGFDRIEDCFEDLAPHVVALETGLSSDPDMNRRWSALDRFRLVSNSDAHSPANLGREANLFDAELSWHGVATALRTGAGFRGTIEFHPEEGKYHFDGHRACGVCQDPGETRRRGPACPACGRPLTVGVLHRVLALADRERPEHPRPSEAFQRLVPLAELAGEAVGTGPASKAATALYARLVSSFGSELAFLREAPLEDIARTAGTLLAEAVRRVRAGEVETSPGFDGEFGTVRVFRPGERERFAGQDELFGGLAAAPRRGRRRAGEPRAGTGTDRGAGTGAGAGTRAAGPRALAVTFTNRAADEMRERLKSLLGAGSERVTVCTLHAFCHALLDEHSPASATVYGPRDREELLRLLLPADRAGRAATLAERIGRCLEGVGEPEAELLPLLAAYRARLAAMRVRDLAALVADTVALLRADAALLADVRARWPVVAVDELQDVDPRQFELLDLVGGGAVLGIGDPDQAIYGFRGADRSLFYRFRDEPGTEVHVLPRNYRSRPAIVRAATAVLADRRSVPVAPVAVRPAGGVVRVAAAADPAAEAAYIAATIRRLVGGVDSGGVRALDGDGGGRSFADFAVLFRTRAVRDALLPALARSGLPFTVRAEVPVSAAEPWRTVVAALRFLANPDDRVALAEVLGRPARALDRRSRAALADDDGRGDIGGLLRRFASAADDPGLAASAAFAARLHADRDVTLARVATGGMEPVLDALIDELVPAADPDPRADPEAEVLRLAARAAGGDLARFLAAVGLAARESEAGPRPERVRLLTFHAAKGLEFPVVFIAGAEEGIVPLAASAEGGADADEERRLFYVAMTRARDDLYLSYSLRRTVHGTVRPGVPSRYLADIPADACERVDADLDGTGRPRPRGHDDGQLALF